jgi:hypothetical protein
MSGAGAGAVFGAGAGAGVDTDAGFGATTDSVETTTELDSELFILEPEPNLKQQVVR